MFYEKFLSTIYTDITETATYKFDWKTLVS